MDWVDKSMRLLIISFVYLTRDISSRHFFWFIKVFSAINILPEKEKTVDILCQQSEMTAMLSFFYNMQKLFIHIRQS